MHKPRDATVYSTHSAQPYGHCCTEMGASAHLLSCYTSIGAGAAGPTQARLSSYAKITLWIGISMDKEKHPPCKQKTNSVKQAILLPSQYTCKHYIVMSNVSHLAYAKPPELATAKSKTND